MKRVEDQSVVAEHHLPGIVGQAKPSNIESEERRESIPRGKETCGREVRNNNEIKEESQRGDFAPLRLPKFQAQCKGITVAVACSRSYILSPDRRTWREEGGGRSPDPRISTPDNARATKVPSPPTRRLSA